MPTVIQWISAIVPARCLTVLLAGDINSVAEYRDATAKALRMAGIPEY
jgi:hypothetical protein